MNQMRGCGGTRAHCTMVVADDRERNSEIIKIVSNVDNVLVAIKRLAVGDYIVDRRASLAELQ